MNTQRIEQNNLDLAISLINDGKIVAFPTDTVYGLGCLYDNIDAINAIKLAKGRDENKPLPMMCANKEMIVNVAYVNDIARKIIDKLMPGALTIVLKRKDTVKDYVTNGKDTIAIRIPDHKLVLEILNKVNKPMLVTSANLSDYPSGHHDYEVINQLDGKIDGIVMGSSCAELASTIVLVEDNGYKILRQGKITDEKLKNVLEGD